MLPLGPKVLPLGPKVLPLDLQNPWYDWFYRAPKSLKTKILIKIYKNNNNTRTRVIGGGGEMGPKVWHFKNQIKRINQETIILLFFFFST